MAPFAVTVRQREALEAMERARGNRKVAAASLGVTERSLNRLLEAARHRVGAESTYELALMYGRSDMQVTAWPHWELLRA